MSTAKKFVVLWRAKDGDRWMSWTRVGDLDEPDLHEFDRATDALNEAERVQSTGVDVAVAMIIMDVGRREEWPL